MTREAVVEALELGKRDGLIAWWALEPDGGELWSVFVVGAPYGDRFKLERQPLGDLLGVINATFDSIRVLRAECRRKPGRQCQADYGEPPRCEWCDRVMR